MIITGLLGVGEAVLLGQFRDQALAADPDLTVPPVRRRPPRRRSETEDPR